MATKQKPLPGMAKHAPRPSRVPGYKPRTPEADEQAALIRWARLWASHGTQPIPALALLYSSLNGVRLTPSQASKAKAGGMVAGVWDMFLPVTATMLGGWGGTYSGLWLEMKSARGRLSDEQKAFREAVGGSYLWGVCRTWHEAARTLLEYLSVPLTHPAWSGLETPNAD
jgi:hypothetical protein